MLKRSRRFRTSRLEEPSCEDQSQTPDIMDLIEEDSIAELDFVAELDSTAEQGPIEESDFVKEPESVEEPEPEPEPAEEPVVGSEVGFNLFEQRQLQYFIGKMVGKDIVLDNGEVLTSGERITPNIVTHVTTRRTLMEVTSHLQKN